LRSGSDGSSSGCAMRAPQRGAYTCRNSSPIPATMASRSSSGTVSETAGCPYSANDGELRELRPWPAAAAVYGASSSPASRKKRSTYGAATAIDTGQQSASNSQYQGRGWYG